MSERDELAGIAKSLRRKLERERAAGLGELLAEGATAALREPRATLQPASSRTPAPQASTAEEERPDLAEPEVVSNLGLFGEPEVMPRRAASPVVLPSAHSPLNTVDVAARAAILEVGRPVLLEIAAEARACTKCGLCETRTQAVPGVGSGSTGIVFVGEAPGADEDRLGEPFVGRAGQLLTKIIQAMDDAHLIPGVTLNRDTVFICNVLKCRPPENRNPLPHEIESCSPYLRRQLELIQPKIICCLGKFAAELLVGVKGTIGGLRGKVYRYQGSKLIVTYHPAACLRNPDYKRPVWEDMQLLAREYQAS